jgi:hypothetical protein
MSLALLPDAALEMPFHKSLMFEPKSTGQEIGVTAFAGYYSLQSICVLPLVEMPLKTSSFARN